MIEPWITLIIAVTVLLILIMLKIPIAVSLALVGVIGLWWYGGWEVMFEPLKFYPYRKTATWLLAAVPLFIMMGYFADAGGVTRGAFATAYKLIGRLPGGLAHATILASAMFAACSGSSVATAGTMGKISVPEMLKYGYDKKLATGTALGGSLLGIMIPPSVVFVVYAAITEESVGELLIAGILPGILCALIYMMGIGTMSMLRPEIAPKGPSFSWGERIMSIKDVWGIVLLAAIIIGGIYSGVFTATEAAAVGAFAALLIGLSGGRKAIPKIVSALEETARTTSLVFFLIVGSTFFAFFLTMSGVTIWVAETVINLPLPKAGILAMIIFIYLPLGMIMDTMSMMLITLPIVYPIVIQLGYNGVWFGVIITQLCELALITPPVGMNLYVIQGVSPPGVTLEDVLMGSVPIIIMQFVTLSIIVAFPQISLLLPSLMVK